MLLLGLHMLSPSLVGTQLLLPARLEILLNNGRVPISLQLVYLVLWYGSLLHLISMEAIAAACIAKRLFPGIRLWLLALIEAVAVFLAAENEVLQNFIQGDASAWLFPAIGLLMILAMAIAGLSKGDGRTCGAS